MEHNSHCTRPLLTSPSLQKRKNRQHELYRRFPVVWANIQTQKHTKMRIRCFFTHIRTWNSAIAGHSSSCKRHESRNSATDWLRTSCTVWSAGLPQSCSTSPSQQYTYIICLRGSQPASLTAVNVRTFLKHQHIISPGCRQIQLLPPSRSMVDSHHQNGRLGVLFAASKLTWALDTIWPNLRAYRSACEPVY